MNKHKKFIKDAYEGKINGSLCQEWKEAIEKHYPEFKQITLEVGKWYRRKSYPEALFCFKEIKEGIINGYGFPSESDYCENYNAGRDFNDFYETTDKEVKTALINEAKKKGFKKGVIAKWAFGENENEALEKNVDDLFCHINDGAMLTDGLGHSLFYDGKWAEIIETITKEEAEKLLGKTII